MQKNILIIGLKNVDLSPNTVVGLTFQSNDVGDIETKNGNFSNAFRIPFTENNRRIFENAEYLNSGTDMPYKQLLADYYEDGLPIVQDGVLTITETSNGYSCRLNSGNTSFFSQIGDETVGDVFGNSFHVMDVPTMIAGNALTEDYVYPICNFAISNTPTPTYIIDTDASAIIAKYLRPCARVKRIFELISERYQFELLGSFIDSDEINKLFLTPDNCKYTPEQLAQIQTDSNFFSEREITGYEVVGNIPEAPIGDSFTYFKEVDSTPNTSYSVTIDSVTTMLGGNGDLKLEYDFTAFIKMTDTPVIEYDRQKGIRVEILKIGTGVIASDTLVSDSLYAEDWFYDAIGTLTLNYNVVAGDQFYARILFEIQEADNTGFDYGFNDAGTFKLTFTPNVNFDYGCIVYMRSIFTMKLKDFLKDVMKMYGLTVFTNGYTRQVWFNFFEDLNTNKAIAPDWSNKVDIRDLSLQYTFGNYAQKNLFKWSSKDYGKYYGSENGNGFFTVDNTNLPIESTVVQMVASHLYFQIGDFDSRVTGFNVDTLEWFSPNNCFGNRFDVSVEYADFGPFPELSNLVDPNGNVTAIGSELVGMWNFGTYFGTPSTTDLYGGAILNKYYLPLYQMLQKTKVLTCNVFLNANDVRNFNPSIPVRIDVGQREFNVSGYFYVNLISQYKGGLTKVVLVRL